MNEYEYKICIRLLSRKMLAVQVLQDILARSYTENTIYQKTNNKNTNIELC